MREFGPVLLPVTPVESGYRNAFDRDRFKTTCIDAVAVRFGARHVKRFDTADIAEKMLGDSGVESVRREMFRALE